jgi:hypothetical protein
MLICNNHIHSPHHLSLQGTGEAQCSNPSISWRPDGFVYGGTGSARISEGADRGCNTQIRVIDEVLQPCCKPMADLIGGPSGLAAKAPKGSIQAKAYQYLLSKVKVNRGHWGLVRVETV